MLNLLVHDTRFDINQQVQIGLNCYIIIDIFSLRKHAYSNILKILHPKKEKFLTDKNF